ncbi:MAG: hypothetical protein DCF17_00300 [Shackletoniella antarctica]|uniref:CopG family transcriptional regulator n=1 Tax=Shackletoniella antarctica TaxID=268115 RepID=A0A2W4WL26_9CYAN|nr:MAG: hypothetical protein DCF17_00300 [Shackletoniella antarctica]
MTKTCGLGSISVLRQEGPTMTTPDNSTPERIVRFTVDMPESLHEQLSQKADHYGKKKAMVVRLAIAQTLKD